jgi:hypothetical protein
LRDWAFKVLAEQLKQGDATGLVRAFWCAHPAIQFSMLNNMSHKAPLFGLHLVTLIREYLSANSHSGLGHYATKMLAERLEHVRCSLALMPPPRHGHAGSNAEYFEEMLYLSQRIVALVRVLAKDHPRKYNHALSTSLRNLSQHQNTLRLRDDAWKSVFEAVDLLIDPARSPTGTTPIPIKYAYSLQALVTYLGDFKSEPDAFNSAYEAASFCAQLTKENP